MRRCCPPRSLSWWAAGACWSRWEAATRACWSCWILTTSRQRYATCSQAGGVGACWLAHSIQGNLGPASLLPTHPCSSVHGLLYLSLASCKPACLSAGAGRGGGCHFPGASSQAGGAGAKRPRGAARGGAGPRAAGWWWWWPPHGIGLPLHAWRAGLLPEHHMLPLIAANTRCPPCRLPLLPLQLLRMHLLENVRVRVEAGHIDYVNELRWGQRSGSGSGSLVVAAQVVAACVATAACTAVSWLHSQSLRQPWRCMGKPLQEKAAACINLNLLSSCLPACPPFLARPPAGWAPSCSWGSPPCWSRRRRGAQTRRAPVWERCRRAWRRCRSACASTMAASCRQAPAGLPLSDAGSQVCAQLLCLCMHGCNITFLLASLARQIL